MAESVSTAGMRLEKKAVALNSIYAAVGITLLKVIVGHYHRQSGHSLRGRALRA